jgi:hypothetical protein
MISTLSAGLEAVRNAYPALEVEAAKVGLKINELKTKYMIAAGHRTILDAGQTLAFGLQEFQSRQRVCVLGSSCDTEERRGFGDTAKNPNCK